MASGKTDKISLGTARKILRMLNGDTVSYSQFPVSLAEELMEESILTPTSRGSFRSYRINNVEGCITYLAQHYAITGNLEEWIELKSREGSVSRAEQVAVVGDSKARSARTFKGFLLNSYVAIEAFLCDKTFVINPIQGSSIFLEDYEHFRIPEDVIVVGMENGENFQYIRAQQYLFKEMKILFVSRYPQSKDLRTWLQMIPNRYIHFGDFDLAGVHIYLKEFYAFLRERAEFFIPMDVEERLENGNRKLYDEQYARYKDMTVADERLLPLVEMIHKYKRVYEQEGYIIPLAANNVSSTAE